MKQVIFAILASIFAAYAQTNEATVKRTIQLLIGNRTIENVSKTPYRGLYEVVIGRDILYTDENAEYILQGELIDVKTRKNITQDRINSLTAIKSTDLPLDIALKRVRGNGSRTLITFEDPNCPYCKRMAKDLRSTDNITIYTFIYPILSADSVQMAKRLWCSADREKAWSAWMEDAKAPDGRMDCENPIERVLELGKRLGLSGTPTLFLSDGTRIPGAISASQLEQKLAVATVQLARTQEPGDVAALPKARQANDSPTARPQGATTQQAQAPTHSVSTNSSGLEMARGSNEASRKETAQSSRSPKPNFASMACAKRMDSMFGYWLAEERKKKAPCVAAQDLVDNQTDIVDFVASCPGWATTPPEQLEVFRRQARETCASDNATVPNLAGQQTNSTCQPTMAFLASRIPSFSAPELQSGRQSILAENVRTAMSKARAQGFTSQGAIKASLDQAKEFDRVSREAAQCASDVDALGATDDEFLAAMRQGRAPNACTGIRNSCLCAGILNRMAAVGSRALAAEMQCFARSGG